MSDDVKAVSFIKVDFDPPLDDKVTLIFDHMRGTEELGRPFFYELQMTSGKLVLDVSKLVGATAKINLTQSKTKDDKYINGIVTRVLSEGLLRGANHYRIEVRPWIWLLTQVTDCHIFQNKSAFDIITGVFRDAGFSDFSDKRQNSAGSIELDYCVQYRETTFDFVSRLMEQFGLYYFFEHDETKHTLVFTDDPNAHTELPDAIPFQFDQTEHRTVDDHIWEWASDYGLHSGKYTVRDYNFTTPSADLTAAIIEPGKHPKFNELEVYEYPGPYWVVGDGQKLADVRMQAIASERILYHGASNSRKLHAGWKFKLDKFQDKSANRDYLIVRSEISTTIAEGLSTTQDGGETVDSYRVHVHAIPGDVPFRLQRKTSRPMIRGPQTAKVVGASGDEVMTDEYGRVKVKFHWDRSSTEDENRTCWIRVAQSWAGNQWGAMVIPRVGMEVVVEFLEGNPDRPLITGVVYNATQRVPYPLPDNKTQSGFKTNSSQGGNGSNELRFEDKAGSEEVYLHAQKDFTMEVKHDSKTTVQEGNRSITVSQGDDSLTVSTGNHSVTVSSGNHSLAVSAGTSDVKAATSITLTSGGSSIQISPSGVVINAPQIQLSASATMSLDGGGSMTLTAGMISIN